MKYHIRGKKKDYLFTNDKVALNVILCIVSKFIGRFICCCKKPSKLILFLKECVNKLEPILNVSDDRIMAEVITRWFNRVSDGQVSPLWDEEIGPKIELTLRGEKIFNIIHGKCRRYSCIPSGSCYMRS